MRSRQHSTKLLKRMVRAVALAGALVSQISNAAPVCVPQCLIVRAAIFHSGEVAEVENSIRRGDAQEHAAAAVGRGLGWQRARMRINQPHRMVQHTAVPDVGALLSVTPSSEAQTQHTLM